MASILNNFATWLNYPFAVRVNSGTDGLVLTLRPGGEAITQTNTFQGAVLGLSLTETTPVPPALDKEIFNYLSPIYLQSAFANNRRPPDRFPVCKRLAKGLLCLPIRASRSNTGFKTFIAVLYRLFGESQ